jgi:hypothetical protein
LLPLVFKRLQNVVLKIDNRSLEYTGEPNAKSIVCGCFGLGQFDANQMIAIGARMNHREASDKRRLFSDYSDMISAGTGSSCSTR